MKFIIEYWSVIVAAVASSIVLFFVVRKFFFLPSDEQQAKVKEWLIWACIEAEKSLQSGTGQLKLRKVYDAFLAISSFQWIAKVISFETFSTWVSIALEDAKKMLTTNTDLAKYVYGDSATEEVAKLKAQLDLC